MRNLLCFIALAIGLTAFAQVEDDLFFFKRATLLDYVAEQEWTLKSPSTVRDNDKLHQRLCVDNITASYFGAEILKPVSMCFGLNPETMAMMVSVCNDDDCFYDDIFNSAMDHVVYAYDLSNMSEVSLCAVEPDGTRRWISISNPDAGKGNDTLFVIHRAMSLPDEEPLMLHLTHDQFVALTDILAMLGEANYINTMPYGPD